VSSRSLAVDALVRVEDGAYAHILVPQLLTKSDLSPRDRGFVTDLVYGTIRMQRAVDHLLAPVSARPLASLDPPVRAALRLGAYQLLTGVAAHAAVGESVEVVPPHARGFANGVLRALARTGPPFGWPPADSVTGIAVRTSHPDWIAELFVREFGRADALATLALNDEPPPVTLRVNSMRAAPHDIERELLDLGVDVERGGLVPEALVLRHAGDVGGFACVRDGRATPQDQSSQAVVALLDPQPGERILDVAAAPGGKATAAAERMGDTGLVVAGDLHPGRVRTVARARDRIGLTSVVPIVADGHRLPVPPESFDRVLLDAPCSGLGVLRRRPDARWRVEPDDVRQLAGLQRELLAGAAAAVRPGGRLVYAVCTIAPDETRAVAVPPGFVALDPPGAPWRPHGAGALLLPSDAQTDGMFVLAMERSR